MATTTFIYNTTLTGAGATGTDLLSGTAVSNAGSQGKVWVSATSFVNHDEPEVDGTFTVFGRESGITVVPADSGFVAGNKTSNSYADHGKVIFYGRVNPNEPLTLNITSGAGSTGVDYSVMVKTE